MLYLVWFVNHRLIKQIQFNNAVRACLEVLSQLVNHSSVFAPNPLTSGAAVSGVVADMDACSRERGAVSAGTRRALGGALTLGAVVRVQEIPFSNIVYAAVGLAGALLVSGDREAQTGLRAKHKCQSGRAYCALQGNVLTETLCHGSPADSPRSKTKQPTCGWREASTDLLFALCLKKCLASHIVSVKAWTWRDVPEPSTGVCVPLSTEPGRRRRFGA